MMENIEIKILEFLKGLGTILLYFVTMIIASILLADFYYHSNIVIATIAQIFVYVLLLVVLGALYHKRLIHDFNIIFKQAIKEYKLEFTNEDLLKINDNVNKSKQRLENIN